MLRCTVAAVRGVSTLAAVRGVSTLAAVRGGGCPL